MGEAKRRGNQEQRIFEAITRNEAEKVAFKKMLPIQASRQRTVGRGFSHIGLAIALSALGTTAIEVRQHEN